MEKIKHFFLKLFASIGIFFTTLFSFFLIFKKHEQKQKQTETKEIKQTEQIITEVQNEIEKTDANIILDNANNSDELHADIDRITNTTRTNIRNRINNIVQSASID